VRLYPLGETILLEIIFPWKQKYTIKWLAVFHLQGEKIKMARSAARTGNVWELQVLRQIPHVTPV